MDWLKTHEYLAVWLSLPLMTILGIVQNLRREGKGISVTRMTLYFAFMICLAAAFTPTLDDSARFFGGAMCIPLMFITAYHAYIELINTYPKMSQRDSNKPSD
jgi:hypothetical protein